MRFHFSFDTKASPQQVVAAFTDFSERRLEVWQGSLDPSQYELLERGETWAVAREGSTGPSVWAVERYDWSEPGTVRWAAEGSDFCKPGSGVELVIAANAGGGSHVEGEWHRSPAGVKGAVIVPLARMMMPRMLPKQWAEALDTYADNSTR